jgi:hypothetical protein
MQDTSRSGSYARIGRRYPRPQPAAAAREERSMLRRLASHVAAVIRRLRSRS